MPFNPCGRGVDYLEDSVTDTIRPFRDSDITVRRRWFRVAEGTPLLGFPSAFLSAHYEAFPWYARNVGEVYPPEPTYERRGTPDGFDFEHICGAEADFQIGAVYDPTLNVQYDSEWIPLCCGREEMCTTQLCAQTPIHDRPAAQLTSYPIPHQDATPTTPFEQFQIANNQGQHDPAWPGHQHSWWPGGSAAAVGWNVERVADDLGVMRYVIETTNFAGGASITQRQEPNLWSVTVDDGPTNGTLTLSVVNGVVELCGENLRLCPAILPLGAEARRTTALIATGTTQADAALVTTTNIQAAALAITAGVRLPATDALITPTEVTGQIYAVVHSIASPVASLKIYPAAGESIEAIGLDNPITIERGRGYLFVAKTGQYGNWAAIPYPPTATGTVTSVNLTAPASGITVSGGPIVATGSITLALADDLAALEALAGTNTLYYRSGVSTWTAVTIGDWLNFAVGVLKVVPPTATSGQTVGATFTLTGLTGVYQATGITFALPAAGTYLVTGRVNGYLQSGAAGYHFIGAQLRNNTAGAFVANTETMVCGTNVNATFTANSASFSQIVTVGAASTLELYASRTGTVWTISQIVSDGTGRTVFDWVRLY